MRDILTLSRSAELTTKPPPAGGQVSRGLSYGDTRSEVSSPCRQGSA